MKQVSLMFGGNLGNVAAAFEFALSELENNGFNVTDKSSVFLTAPVDCVPGTPDFQNMAVLGNWSKSPRELLQLTQSIEQRSGRPAEHSSREARTLDIDIITFGQDIISEPDLIIPHPRAQQRLFVLEPLYQIAPSLIFPDSSLPVSALFFQVKKSLAKKAE